MEKFEKDMWAMPAKKFKALGHPIRLWIAQQVVEEEHCVQEFVQLTDLDFSTISQHLSALKEAGVLVDEKRGKQVFYRLKCACVRKFLTCVAENRARKACQTTPNEEECV